MPRPRCGVVTLLVGVVVSINFFFQVKYYPNLEIDPTSTDHSIGNSLSSEDEAANSHLPWNLTKGVHIFHDRIDTIRLLGERHSGTTYLTRYLVKCFPQHSVNDYLVRKKHWFQPSPDTIIRVTQTVDQESLAEATNFERFVPDYKSWWEIAHRVHPKSLFQTSLVLVAVRDPYQWIEAMRLGPWHWPNHLRILPKNQSTIATMRYSADKVESHRRRLEKMENQSGMSTLPTSKGIVGMPKGEKVGGTLPSAMRIQKSYFEHEALDWSDFLRAPLWLKDEDLMAADSAKICRNGFPKGTLSPCLQNRSYVPPTLSHIPRAFLRNLPFGVNNAVYELKLDKEPFEHPMALRAAKIQNLLNLVQTWDLGGFAVIRYEDILGGSGNNSSNLNALVQHIADALGTESQCPPHKSLAKKPYILPEGFTKWVGDHTDWEIESRVGYTRSD